MGRSTQVEQIDRNNEIASKYRAGGITHKQLAAEYGVSRERIRHIIVRVARTERENVCRAELRT